MLSALTVLLTLTSPLEESEPGLELPALVTQVATEDVVAELTSSVAWVRIDPTWKNASDFEAAVFRFGSRQIVRITPKLGSKYGLVPVEGADRVVTVRDGRAVRVKVGAPLRVLGSFVLTESEALATATRAVPGGVVDAKVAAGLARRVYVDQTDGVRAAWRVRVPTLRLEDLRDVWLDAESGELLRTQPVARFHREVRR